MSLFYLFHLSAGGTDISSVDSQTMENLVSWLLERSELQIVESESDSSDSSIDDVPDESDMSDSMSEASEEEEGAFGEVSCNKYT